MEFPGNIKVWLDDNLGVSSILAVVLILTSTVVVAALVGTTALEINSIVDESPPQAQFEIVQNNQYEVVSDRGGNAELKAVTITHTGKEEIDFEKLRVTVNQEPAYAYTTDADYFTEHDNGWAGPIEPWQGDDTISSGDETTIIASTSYIEDSDVTVDPETKQRVLFNFGTKTTEELGELWFDGSWQATNGDSLLESGDRVRVSWESGEESQILAEHKIQ